MPSQIETPDPNPENPWAIRANALSKLDGDELDREDALFQVDWKREYRKAFERIAVGRKWNAENARDWAHHLVDEAFIDAYVRDYDPEACALFDVQMSEQESDPKPDPDPDPSRTDAPP